MPLQRFVRHQSVQSAVAVVTPTRPIAKANKSARNIFSSRSPLLIGCFPFAVLFSWFPREDTAADHNQNEDRKLHLLHRGVLRRPTPLREIIRHSAYQVLRQSSGSLAILAAIRRASLPNKRGPMTKLFDLLQRCYSYRVIKNTILPLSE
jgi:hypothetical protein